MSKRLLFLTASTGAGHISASNALEREALRCGCATLNIDCMDVTSPFFREWFRGGYERLVREKPQLWGHLYRTSDKPRFNYQFQTALDNVFMGRLGPVIQSFRPDWVVCTHSVPQPRLAGLRRRFKFRTAIVVTDLYPHRMWIRGEPDLYCVPTEWSLAALRERVGTGPRAVVTGIPIAPEFGVDDGPVASATPSVLLTAGGIGGGPVVEAAKELARMAGPVRVEVLCGSNRATLEALQALPQIEALPSIPNEEVAKMMRQASLVIGKSGGLTTSEAMACGLPFVVFDPFLIPGQEEQNAEFLVEVGAGTRVPTLETLRGSVETLLADPSGLARMRVQALAHARPRASQDILALLEDI